MNADRKLPKNTHAAGRLLTKIFIVTTAFIVTVFIARSILVQDTGGQKAWSRSSAGLVSEIQKKNILPIKEYWGRRLVELGPVAAREELETFYGDTDVYPRSNTQYKILGTQHTAAHVFGILLFEKFGIDGIAYCTNQFSYGCYHQVAISTISAQNEAGAIVEVDRACGTLGGYERYQCFHGSGHAVLATYGYDKAALDAALNDCDKFQNDQGDGCYYGAFMEFNLRFLQHAEDMYVEDVRKFTEGENLYFPCNSVAGERRAACLIYQPMWWEKLFPKDYQKIGELCGAMPDETDRTNCFMGVGKVLVYFTRGGSDRIKEICNTMPDNEIANCLHYAVATYAMLERKYVTDVSTTRLCETFSAKDTQLCARDVNATLEKLLK